MEKPIRMLRHLTLNERTKIGELYLEGLKVATIAPLYDTNNGTINNVLAFLRKNGVIIPMRKPRKVKVPKQELLILPEEPKVAGKRGPRVYRSNGDKRRAFQLYRSTGDINEVVKTFNVTKQNAYNLVKRGQKLMGIKGRNRRGGAQVRETVPRTERLGNDNIGFFFLGYAASLIIQIIFF